MATAPRKKSRPQTDSAPPPNRGPGDLPVYLLLGIACLAVFHGVHGYDFFHVDDNAYIVGNLQVQQGITLENLGYALFSTDLRIWHPLTFLSHMLDCQIFGLNPGGHHLHNLLLHLLCTGLVYGLLRRFTGDRWPSAVVALLFAVHPYHVEPVVSISSRKDLLCGLFWLLSVWAYHRHTLAPSRARYGLVAFFFLLALLSKATAVMIPFSLLVLDFWPLRRITLASPRETRAQLLRCVLEKTPLFVLSAAGMLITFLVSTGHETISQHQNIPLATRIAASLVVHATYLYKTLLPHGFSFVYLDTGDMPPLWQVVGAALLLVIITAFALHQAGRRPWLLAGWAWFLVVMLPANGLVRNAPQIEADRYTYIPLIGIFAALVWTVAGYVEQRRLPARAVGAVAGVLLLALSLLSWAQAELWRIPETLYEHALALDERNFMAHTNLGALLLVQGDTTRALAHLERARELSPVEDPYILFGLADARAAQGRLEEALALRAEGARLWPTIARNQVDTGVLLLKLDRQEEALPYFEAAVKLNPEDAIAHMMLANALGKLGRVDAAVSHFEEAARHAPGEVAVRLSYGAFLEQCGDTAGAVAQYRAALGQEPGLPPAVEALNRLGAPPGP